jgi:hypothetical protein
MMSSTDYLHPIERVRVPVRTVAVAIATEGVNPGQTELSADLTNP